MDNQFEITLDSVGFAVFDPSTLQSFVAKHGLSEDIFEEFQLKPLVGDDAIKSGVIVPVYSIPPLDYQILLTQGDVASVKSEWIKFTTPSFPFLCESEKVVVSDISALMDWDYEFYQNLTFSTDKLPYNVFTVEQGSYSVRIVGFCEKEWTGSGPTNKGYELLFQRVENLPQIDDSVDSDSVNYTVYSSI